MRVSRKIPEDFKSLQEKLPAVLETYGISQRHIYESIGMPKATFYRKLKNRDFNAAEMLKIVDVINK